MNSISAFPIVALLLMCVGCLSGGGEGRTFDGNKMLVRIEMRGGDIRQSDYERHEALGEFFVLRSTTSAEPIILVRASDANNVVPFGRWSSIHELDDKNLREVILLLEGFVRKSVMNDIDRVSPGIEVEDVFDVEVPKSERKVFDPREAAEKCITHFEAGWLPRRILGEDSSYVLDCVMLGGVDSGYLISIENRSSIFHVTHIEPYQYDRILRSRTP